MADPAARPFAYPFARTYIGALCAFLALLIAVLGLLGIAHADEKIVFICVALLALAGLL